MVSVLKGGLIQEQTFALYGVAGIFHVQPKTKWTIHHFSTKASSSNDGDGGNCLSLLRELKPMRERVEASKIQDMASLLQRDLNDERVASDLIPYLLENAVGVGFFPGVLVALVPKGFLSNRDSPTLYPAPKRTQTSQDFAGFWNLDRFTLDDGKPSALGKLTINPDKTDLIVLDGQHRANAFRFATKTFDGVSNGENTIYAPFYSSLAEPKGFDSELPVTIVWFEALSNHKVTPLDISRRIFVDVNTNARRVDESRNILLDDRNLASMITGAFYSKLALHGFDAGKLSLLHGAHDGDEHHRSALTLFTPVDIRYMLLMFALGKDEFDDISCRVKRDTSEQQSNHSRCFKFFQGLPAANRPKLGQELDLPNIRQAAASTLCQYLYDTLVNFPLCSNHVESTRVLASKWMPAQGATIQESWRKIYGGGEGLFTAFRSAARPGAALATTNPVREYLASIDEIERQFRSTRASASRLDSVVVERAYATFTSKASITGYFMALSLLADERGWEAKSGKEKNRAVDEFIGYIKKTALDSWIIILTEFKVGAVGSELNPRLWPQMRGLYLRILQSNGSRQFFTDQTIGSSPDFQFVKHAIDNRLKGFRATHAQKDAPARKRDAFVEASMKELDSLLLKCKLKPLHRVALERMAREHAHHPSPAAGHQEDDGQDEAV